MDMTNSRTDHRFAAWKHRNMDAVAAEMTDAELAGAWTETQGWERNTTNDRVSVTLAAEVLRRTGRAG